MEAFLKARSRNIVEDVRLKNFMFTLELEKKQWEKRVFNETYEEQTLAFAYKKVVNEKTEEGMKAKKKEAEIKEKMMPRPVSKLPDIRFLTNRLVASDGEFGEPSERGRCSQLGPTKPPTPDYANVRKVVSQPPKALPAIKMTGGFTKISIDIEKKKPPRIRKQVQREELSDVPPTDRSGAAGIDAGNADTSIATKMEDDTPADNPDGPLSALKFPNIVERMLGNNKEDENREEAIRNDPQQSPRDMSERFGKFSILSPAPKKINLKELVDRLFPKALHKARSMEQLEKLKSMDVIEEQKEQHTKETEDLKAEIEADKIEEEEQVDKVVILDDSWLGNPKAISSVRRERQPPEVMTARHKNMGDVMKLIRDLPTYPSCSRNCNHPGVVIDTMGSREPHVMLPSLAKANVRKYNQKMKMKQSMDNVAAQVKAVSAFNKPILRTVKDADLPRLQDAFRKQLENRRLSLRDSARDLRKSLKKASERRMLKSGQHLMAGEQGARLQIAYTLDPVTRLRGPHQNNGRQVKVK